MNLRILFLIVVFSITGCASNNLKEVSGITANETIVIVSKFSNKFRVQTTGTTAFQNSYFEISVDDWDIPDYVEKSVYTVLDKHYSPIMGGGH